MRVLIQDCQTQKFLSPSKLWVEDANRAENFEKTLRAWAEIDERRLSGVRILLNLDDASMVQVARIDNEINLKKPDRLNLNTI